jgi:hypothetical protein
MLISKRSFVLTLLIGLALILAACGGSKKNEKPPAPPALQASPSVGESTPTPGEGPASTEVAVQPGATDTPGAVPPEPVYQDAAQLALADLSARLSVAPDRIEVLESNSALFLDQPLQCPDLPDENQDAYYVYLQYERFIYPYQAYQPADADTVVQACDDVLVDQEVLFVPTPDARTSLLDTIRADLRSRGVDTANGEFRTVRPVTWTDTALGCRVGLGEEVSPALIDGFLFVYVVGGVSYEYHADQSGERLVYCAPPEGYESVDALLAALQADEDLEVTVNGEEPATYNGLDAQGTLIELTDAGYRVGLFGFESNKVARAAAQRIDDPGVSHILVAGNVLVVMEENIPSVYSTLLDYAEEVRTPLLETPADAEQAPDDTTSAGETPLEATLPPTPSE